MDPKPFEQFQPATDGPGGAKFVVVGISVLILFMFMTLIGFAVVSNQ